MFVIINLITIFLALWIMWKNNEDKLKLNKVDYEPLPVYEMTKITVDYVSLILILNIFGVLMYIINIA